MTNITSKLYPLRRLKKSRIKKKYIPKINKQYKGRHNIVSRSLRHHSILTKPTKYQQYLKHYRYSFKKTEPHSINFSIDSLLYEIKAPTNFNLQAWFKQKTINNLQRQAEQHAIKINIILKLQKLNNKRLNKGKLLVKINIQTKFPFTIKINNLKLIINNIDIIIINRVKKLIQRWPNRVDQQQLVAVYNFIFSQKRNLTLKVIPTNMLLFYKLLKLIN